MPHASLPLNSVMAAIFLLPQEEPIYENWEEEIRLLVARWFKSVRKSGKCLTSEMYCIPKDFWDVVPDDPFAYKDNEHGEKERAELHELGQEQRVKILLAVTDYVLMATLAHDDSDKDDPKSLMNALINANRDYLEPHVFGSDSEGYRYLTFFAY